MTMPRSNRTAVWFAVFFILAGAVLRIARHNGWLDLPPNVAPVAAMAIFSGVYLPRRLALTVPAGLMIISDAFIGWYTLGVVIAVYASFGMSIVIGRRLHRRMSVRRLFAASLISSTLFFLITNAAVWQFTPGYSANLHGLLHAYLAGLPFFRNTIIGDLGYTAIFFGLYHAVMVYSRQRFTRQTATPHD